MTNTFSRSFLDETISVLQQIDDEAIEQAATVLASTRDRGGRLFLIGSGGGAGHASHAACDFRKLAAFESYAVTDNVSELTARVNDEGWDTSYAAWLKVSRVGPADCLFVFSVGGGDRARAISVNLVEAMVTAKSQGASIVGVVGRDGGEVARMADAAIVIPTVDPAHVTPQTEGLQAIVWHLLVSHPALAVNTAKWESAETQPTRPVT